MKATSLFLLTIISLTGYATGDSGHKDKPAKGKEYYYKYEREEVSYYRDRTQFNMPEPKVIVNEVTEETPQGISLAHLFNFGKKVHVDADIQLETLIQKDIKIKMTKILANMHPLACNWQVFCSYACSAEKLSRRVQSKETAVSATQTTWHW